MPNTRETLRALVSAFNVNNYDFNAVKTNFKLQSRGGKDCIVVSFDKGMKDYQCSEYLYGIKRKIVGEFYGIEEGDTDEVVLNTAKLIFDVESFPFNNYKESWSVGQHGGFEFVAPIDKGVIFNLKSHLASSLVKDVLEGMPTCSIVTNSFNKGKYLCHSEFPNKELRKQFECEFLSRMRKRYENVPKGPLKVEGNSVYIKDVFDDARFIDSVTRRTAWRIGIDLGIGNDVDHSVILLKDSIINSVYQSTKIIVVGFICASPLNREEASILIPLVLDSGRKRVLTNEEALELNCAFNYAVFNDLYGRTQGKLSLNGYSAIYSIDFSNKEISHCVITKIIESSVINKDHELAIDPELRLQALSPAQSPFNSPTHAGPSGLRTPPNQRKKDTDSGYDSNSPPKPEDSVAHSPSGDPSSGLTELSSPIQEFPTRGHGEELERPPSQGLLSVVPLNPLDIPGTSREFLPRSHLSSSVTNPRSSKCVGAVQNVQAGTSASFQPIDSWSSQGTSGNQWISSTQFTQPGPSGLSWKGAGGNVPAWSSTRSSPAQSAGFPSWSPSGPSSSEDANKDMQATCYVSSPLTTGNDPMSSSLGVFADSPSVKGKESIFSVEPEKQQVTDKSDQKSSDECSEAKSQESESPEKKHGGGLFCKKGMPILAKLSPFKRRSVERDTMCSSKSDLVHYVTEKPLLSKRSASERRVKSNPPSKVTSPTHEGVPEWQQRLDPDQREKLRPFLSPEERKKLNSNSFSPGEKRLLYLTHALEGKRELSRSLCEGEESQLLRLAEAQLSSPDNSSSKKVDRDSGFSSMGSASPAVPHKGSVSSKVKECDLQQAKYMSKALGKN